MMSGGPVGNEKETRTVANWDSNPSLDNSKGASMMPALSKESILVSTGLPEVPSRDLLMSK
jgi:hypothetical protein